MTNKFATKTAINMIRMSFRSITAVLVLFFASNTASSQNAVNAVFNSATSTIQVGQTFTVDVTADFIAAGAVNVFETYVNFNPLDLEVQATPVVPAGTVTALPNESISFSSVATMNSSGNINYGRFTSAPSGHPNNDFVLYTVTFKALRVPPGGTTTLSFNTGFPRITAAAEGVTNQLNSVVSKVFTITSCTPPIASISNSGTCNGQPFNLTLASATGVGPFDLVINGTTYNDIAVSGQITTFTPPTSNFFGAATPPSFDETDAPVTLGLKFSSSVPGFVKGVRFYSSASATGNYTGQLWSNAGVLLANATFTSVTGDAWQQVLFTSPVLITANTTYIVSYRTAAGLYTATNSGLTSTITSGTLTAPSSGTSGGNGVYTYDAVDGIPAPHFPVSTFSAANYWVDVVFTPSQYTFNLTSVTDNGGCTNVGAPLQALTVTSVDCSTLPVTLLNLSATVQDKDVLLRWATASEIDNRGFEIQRKTPNGSWEAVGFVNGAGNSSTQLNYSFLDKNLFSGRYNYRLKQTDIDGHYKFSMIVSALIDGKEEYDVKQNYPNPFRNETTIQYTIPEKAKVNITVYDMSGRVMKVLVNGTQDAGNHAVILYARSLPSGLYYYQVQAGGFKATKKMIIQ